MTMQVSAGQTTVSMGQQELNCRAMKIVQAFVGARMDSFVTHGVSPQETETPKILKADVALVANYSFEANQCLLSRADPLQKQAYDQLAKQVDSWLSDKESSIGQIFHSIVGKVGNHAGVDKTTAALEHFILQEALATPAAQPSIS